VERDRNGDTYMAYIHSFHNWKDIICQGIKSDVKAALLHDKIQFMLGRSDEINFPEKISQYNKENIIKLYKKLTKRKRVRSTDFPCIFYNKKKKYYQFTINKKNNRLTYGGFTSKEHAFRAKNLYWIFFYKSPEKIVNSDILSEDHKNLLCEYNELEKKRKKRSEKNAKTSKYLGVKKTLYGTWNSKIWINGKCISRSFPTELEAAYDYDFRYYQFNKTLENINFPDKIRNEPMFAGDFK
jgi:hypothetical protein